MLRIYLASGLGALLCLTAMVVLRVLMAPGAIVFEAEAVQHLRRLTEAQSRFEAQHSRHAFSLDELGPITPNYPREAAPNFYSRRDMNRVRQGYLYRLVPRAGGYRILAAPWSSVARNWFYYTDESGAIRMHDGGPAWETDPEVLRSERKP